jgi:hypothetical protein
LPTQDEYDDVVHWQSNYQACDTLQMNSSVLERAAMREMSRLDSQLTRDGILRYRTGPSTFFGSYAESDVFFADKGDAIKVNYDVTLEDGCLSVELRKVDRWGSSIPNRDFSHSFPPQPPNYFHIPIVLVGTYPPPHKPLQLTRINNLQGAQSFLELK